jgi:heat shock protein HtpX
MLLEHAPLTAFQVIAGFKAMDLISFVLKDRNRIHTMIKEPIPPVSLEKVERVRSILTPLCNAQKIREPHIYIDTSEEITAALLHSLGVTIVILSPQTVEKLNHAELKAVLAHEIQHVKPWFSCFEMLRSSLLSVAKPCVFVVAACLAFDLLSPQFGKLLAAPLAFGIGAVNRQIASVAVEIAYLYANRHKELKSDLNAVQATGDPEALISALEKLEGTDPQTEQYRILDRLGLLSHPNPKSRAKSIRSVFGSPEAANQDQV